MRQQDSCLNSVVAELHHLIEIDVIIVHILVVLVGFVEFEVLDFFVIHLAFFGPQFVLQSVLVFVLEVVLVLRYFFVFEVD